MKIRSRIALAVGIGFTFISYEFYEIWMNSDYSWAGVLAYLLMLIFLFAGVFTAIEKET